MKHILIFLFLSFSILQAQDYAAVDARVQQYPKRIASAEGLATQIQQDFKSDKERVRAIYTWLALNVNYDMNEFLNGDRFVKFSYANQQDLMEKQKALREYSVESTLKTNNAICEGYAQTFKKVCDLMNIPCLFIDGYSKTSVHDIGKNPPRGDHAWNAVKIDNKWYVLDVTWGAGRASGKTWRKKFSDYFFFTDPDEFVKSHLPSVKGLSFSTKEPTKKQFFDAPTYALGYFKNKLSINSPLGGEIKAKSGETITFTIEKPNKEVKLHYATRADMKPKPLTPVCADDGCTFEVPVTVSDSTDLFIIANRETALQYKLILE